MEGKVEEEKGAMAEDEEEMAEAGEVEKRRMHQCSEVNVARAINMSIS